MRSLMLVLAVLVPTLTQAQSAKQLVDQPGRYQLFQGHYEFVNIKGEGHWSRALFKVDTVTGALFICEGRQIDGKHLSPSQPGKMVQRHYCRPFEEELTTSVQ